MSKLAKWGRWPASVYLAFRGAFVLHGIVLDLPEARTNPHTLGEAVGYFGFWISLLLLFAVSAWGVLRWRKWAHGIAAMLLLLDLVFFGISMVRAWPFSFALTLADIKFLSLPLVDLPVFAWLLQPDVRSAYWQHLEAA